ncbi:hypothetical protein AB4Z43_15690 [Mesorhizobium sp. 2RAF45]|uniref:hypothetical protein n=1 Tax=Mesorhizobium sp. 2RAF45 TaxID=3233001 RepID=UPI003F9E7C83
MATKEFILQGFSKRTHKDALRELFEVADIKSVLVSVAFASESGVGLIEDKLKPSAKFLTVFAGIRNDITSHQAMMRLLGVKDITLYAVDTGARTIVFHPKLFLVRGDKEARMMIGSANLTLGGLNNNIEAGLVLHFDLANAVDKKVVDAVENELLAMPKDHADNVLHIKDKKTLDDMLTAGRLTDEMAVMPPRPSKSAGGGAGAADTIPRIKLRVAMLRRAMRKAKAAPPKQAPAVANPAAAAPAAAPAPPPSVGVELELVWESKSLTRRDLTIPIAGRNTNPSGSINLDKGLLPEEVDHRHYFRDDVFPALTWTAATPTVDEAFAKFRLVIKGIDYGKYDLRIGHTTSTNTRSYEQHNAMTRLSWGPMGVYVRNTSLIGRNLAMYRDKADPTRFVVEID